MMAKQRAFFYKFFQLLITSAFLSICCTPAVFAQQNTALPAAADSVKSIPDTLLFRIEQAQNVVTQINSHNKIGYNTDQISQDLPDIKNNVAEIKEDVASTSRVMEAKTLLSYQTILKGEQQQLAEWRKTLSAYNDNLRHMSQQIIQFSSDTLLTPVQSDSTQKSLYQNQLIQLRQKLQNAGKVTTVSMDTVSNLLANVSTVYFEINDLLATINQHLKKSGENAFDKESPYIWSAPPVTTTTNLGKLFRTSYQGQNHILSYFINNTWDNRILLILLGAVFFIWIFRNFKVIHRLPANPKLASLKFRYIGPVPVLDTLILALCLIPFFEPSSPQLYIQLIQLALLVVLTLFFRHRIKIEKLRFWLVIVALYIVLSVTIAVINYGLILRCVLVFLNLASLYVGVIFYKNLARTVIPKKYLRPVIGIYLILNILAVITNVFGRISLAKVFSQTAIASLVQVVALAVLVHVLSEAFELQIRISSSSPGLLSKINFSKLRRAFRKALFIMAVALWVLVFFINLNFSGALFTFVGTILTKTRSFGNINYTFGDILLFAIIIYLANWLQKSIGILLGGGETDFAGKTEQKSSKLALVRLVIMVIGFFVAITASGFPVDKLTVVLGALSVGIGLGMQNIVNNFVSGIILIFERPFQIGDFVELADKKGKVLDIGIRASRMLTQQGSEVIVPNGDLLSGRLVNWTLTNSYLKTELLIKVSSDTDIETVKKTIQEEVAKTEDAIKNIPVEILFNAVTADTVELKVQIWINSIFNEVTFKGKILEQLFNSFKAKNIKML